MPGLYLLSHEGPCCCCFHTSYTSATPERAQPISTRVIVGLIRECWLIVGWIWECFAGRCPSLTGMPVFISPQGSFVVIVRRSKVFIYRAQWEISAGFISRSFGQKLEKWKSRFHCWEIAEQPNSIVHFLLQWHGSPECIQGLPDCFSWHLRLKAIT